TGYFIWVAQEGDAQECARHGGVVEKWGKLSQE
ncbi:MAG: hypothetical protein ACI92Z_000977, partial [Paracoccaceae bacterium]